MVVVKDGNGIQMQSKPEYKSIQHKKEYVHFFNRN